MDVKIMTRLCESFIFLPVCRIYFHQLENLLINRIRNESPFPIVHWEQYHQVYEIDCKRLITTETIILLSE